MAAAVVVTPPLIFAAPAQAATTAALWHMGSPSAMTDSSGHGNTGSTSGVTGVSGSSGNGYHFNGATSVVTVKDASSLDPGTAPIRITAHLRFTVVPSTSVGDYDIIRKGVSGATGGDWKMEILPPSSGVRTGTAYCSFQDVKGRTAAVRDTHDLADGAWHTVTCAKTSSGVTVTVDGASRSSAASLGSIANSSAVAVGAKPGGGDRYLGDMDEVSIQIG